MLDREDDVETQRFHEPIDRDLLLHKLRIRQVVLVVIPERDTADGFHGFLLSLRDRFRPTARACNGLMLRKLAGQRQ